MKLSFSFIKFQEIFVYETKFHQVLDMKLDETHISFIKVLDEVNCQADFPNFDQTIRNLMKPS